VTFEEMMNAFLEHLRSLRRVKATQANYSIMARDFTRHCREAQACASPHDVREVYLGAYARELEQRKFSRLTIYARHRAVRTWFAWAYLRGHLLTDPLKNTHMPHPPLLPRGAPTEAQVELLLAAPGPYLWGRRDRCLLEFLYCTGVRAGECVGVDLADLDLENGLVRVYSGKTKKERMVPFGDRLKQRLRTYLAEVRPDFKVRPGHEQALWLSKKGFRPRAMDVASTLRTYCRQTGLSITPHTLRHAYATHLMLRGASVVAVQALLGHERISTTQRYTHLVPTDLRRELLATHPRGIRKKPRKQTP